MRRFLSIAALTTASLVIGLILVEIVLRVFGVGFPLFTQADQWTGFALRPRAAGWQRDEGSAWVQINAQGMRDREHAMEKPPNTIRIAVLGDSYAEARQVAMGDAFWSVLERTMQVCEQRGERSVEVLNFGVSGFGTAQEWLQLQTTVWTFDPDIVLLAFTTGNDVRNNSFALEGNRDKPYFALQDGKLSLDLSFRNRPSFRKQMSTTSRLAQWILMRSRTAQLLNRVRTGVRHRSDQIALEHQRTGTGAEAGLDTEIYLDPPPREWEEAWQLTAEILKAMANEVRAHGAHFLVVTLSNGIQVHPDFDTRLQFMQKESIGNILYPDYRVLSIGIGADFPVLMLSGMLQHQAALENVFLHGFENTGLGAGHWNEEGHRRAGEAIADTLCSDEFLR